MAIEAQLGTANFVVVDTSFLIDCSERRYWTIEPHRLIQQPDSRVVIPRGVDAEYYRLMGNGGPADNRQSRYQEIMRLLNLERVLAYEASLQRTLADKLDQGTTYLGDTHKGLSRTDKTIVQAVTEFAENGTRVAVVSGDWGIVSEVDGFKSESGYNIAIYSPWRAPTRQEGIDYLVSGDVFQQMSETNLAENSSQKYLAVAKNQHIGGGCTI